MTIATPVVIIIPGCEHYFSCFIKHHPHSAVGALTPNPRNENPDICNIIEHIELLAIIAMSVKVSGKICLRMIVKSFIPITLANLHDQLQYIALHWFESRDKTTPIESI